MTRRDALKGLAIGGATLAMPRGVLGQDGSLVIGGRPTEIEIHKVSARTVRLTLRPIDAGVARPLPFTGALVQDVFLPLNARQRDVRRLSRVRSGDLLVNYRPSPPRFDIVTTGERLVQRFTFDPVSQDLQFLLPKGPLLGLGEGGARFDRKGTTDQMRNGQVTSKVDGYGLATHGTRSPIQWLIGTDGWAIFIHQPYGRFDFTGTEARFTPTGNDPVPFDIFVVRSDDPAEIMREYARITGRPELPAKWTFGYLQSSRTLAGRDEIMSVARTFREKKLPCDGLIYLGTEFTPSGWNTRNGEFAWHPTNFPDPQQMIEELHAQHFKVIVHIVIEGRRLTGTVHDPCTAAPLPPGRTEDNAWPPDRQVSCYWPAHKPIMDLGVDGWWPDQGDGFDGPSRFNRHRMYWEGTQLLRPNERPFALHRNASAGAQRYGGFIWSGDVQTRWETLKNHVPIAINTALSGLPYWGTDIGGFNPTAEYTAELHVRWFQFGAFNPLFRAHGRQWHLRLPWGWDGGDGGPAGDGKWQVDPAELKRPEVERISRQYLELRYRLMPYLYTAVREGHDTGMPIIRALWLHYPDDPRAVACEDQYLWGRDILVAPVVERGATSRRVYLPRGEWIDFWTNERLAGGRVIDKSVDLATMPLFVRAGAVIPMDPVRQYTDEPVTEPITLVVYPGADGRSAWYEDDGRTFEYRNGDRMTVSAAWQDRARRLTVSLMAGSRMRPPSPRPLGVQLAGASETRRVEFTGRQLQIDL